MYKFKTIIFALIALVFVACEDFLDVNENPNSPTTPTLDKLLTNAQLSISNSIGLGQSGLSSSLSVYTHQLMQRRESSQYGLTGSSYALSKSWEAFYAGALQDLKYIEENTLEAGNLQYNGIAIILKAYVYSVIVDMWGDAPYSQALNLTQYNHPKFDKGSEIYADVFKQIDAGIKSLTTEAANPKKPSQDDLFYNGNIDNWVKFANTLKLRLYNQIRLTRDVSSEIQALLKENQLISKASESFELKYGTSETPENRNPGYQNEYKGKTMEYYISPWFYEQLRGLEGIMKGHTDPRIPYYWVKQITKPGDADNKTVYETADGFISLYFGSENHENFGQSQSRSGTLIGLYPVGGPYDNNQGFYKDGKTVGATARAGKGDVALRILPYFNRLYIEAELAQEGIISKDPADLLKAAVQASFARVNSIAAAAAAPLIADKDIEDYVNEVITRFNGFDDAKKLELIMTQKWIANFGFNIDSYNDYRRTGYPVMFDPNNDALDYTVSIRSYGLSLPYSDKELGANLNAPKQKKPAIDRVFWDKN